MLNTLFPLVNWGMGTALIVIFALVCVVLTVIVINFAMKGKSKKEYMEEIENTPEEPETDSNTSSKTTV